MAGDLSCTAARRDLLRLLLCEGTKPPHGPDDPQTVCAKGLVHPPFETAESLWHRLEETFGPTKVRTVQGIASFVCRKAKEKHP